LEVVKILGSLSVVAFDLEPLNWIWTN